MSHFYPGPTIVPEPLRAAFPSTALRLVMERIEASPECATLKRRGLWGGYDIAVLTYNIESVEDFAQLDNAPLPKTYEEWLDAIVNDWLENTRGFLKHVLKN